ncbi:hypothetical protein ACS0TY_006585 [Phlomoides rotata]
MFDWNDEELTNIIWGEAGENDDHIVPYPDQIEEKPPVLFGHPTKKETNKQTSTISTSEQKNSTIKAEHGVKLESSAEYGTSVPVICLDSWSDGPDPSSSNVTKEMTAQFDKDSEMNPPEDGEQGDFNDYGWANIGSFDDLDRIFSNHDPVFGDMSVGHTDELWSPSKDVSSSPLGPTSLSRESSDMPLGALRTSIDRSEIKAQYMLDPGHHFISGYEKLNEISSHPPQHIQTPMIGGKTQACLKQLNDGTAAAPNEFPGKANRQKRTLKGKKLNKKSEVGQLCDLSGSWTRPGSTLQQFNTQYAPSMINPGPPLVLTQQSPLQRPDSFQQKHYPCAPLGSPSYGNIANHHLPQFHPREANHDLVSSSYEVPPSSSISLKNSEDSPAKPLAMTPKEKIEKLRRRQQMRAILAIQKQQLQFGNQVSVSDHSGMEGGTIEVNESLGSFPSIEPSSPLEQYDSSTISMTFDNCSVEESVLYRLQYTISKLDIRIKLCIRDSLFRLAQSSVQRQYPNDTSSTSTSSRDKVLNNKDVLGHERFTRRPDVETDTNPIDRAVAHLLFHRPVEFSEKPAETHESPLSASLPYGKKGNSSKSADVFSEGDQSKNDPSSLLLKIQMVKCPNEGERSPTIFFLAKHE